VPDIVVRDGPHEKKRTAQMGLGKQGEKGREKKKDQLEELGRVGAPFREA